MKKPSVIRVAGLVTGMWLTGCASFEPAMRGSDLLRSRQPSAQQTVKGLEISIEEFASEQKSRQAFDAHLASSGVLALLVRAENNGTASYKISQQAITVTLDGQALSKIDGTDAAHQSATSEYAGKALGWTVATGPFAILLWPATIAGSAAHTRSVNRRIEQHFESLQLNNAVLRPNQVAPGFVYFKLPENLKQLQGLIVEMQVTEEPGGAPVMFNFKLPAITLG
jgi:hypothetical protein